jgi:hypothetical protein
MQSATSKNQIVSLQQVDGQADSMAFDLKDEDYFEHENEDDCFN